MPDALQQGGMGEAFMAPLRGAVDDEQLTMGIAFARVQHPNMYRGPDGACELRCYPLRATPEAQIWRSASRAIPSIHCIYIACIYDRVRL